MVGQVRAALAYSGVILRQLTRDRAALFFLIVLPIAIIVIIGTVFGGVQTLELGLVNDDGDGRFAAEVVAELDAAEGIHVSEFASVDELRRAVRREAVSHGVVIPDGFSDALESDGVAEVVHIVNPTDGDWFAIRTTVQGVIDRVGVRVSAAHIAAGVTGAPVADELDAVEELASATGPSATITDVGDERVAELSRFALIAPQQLVLFVFVNSLGSAVALVLARRSGVLRRAFATRTPLAVLLIGVLLGWFMVALAESVLIVLVGILAFGVNWGDPVGATALVLVFAAVGGGAGLLLGVVGRNEDRVSAMAPMFGMVLGALGGCMVPLEFFSGSMLWVARCTPHYWAVSAWQRLVFDGEGIEAIADSLLVLAMLAVVLIGTATWLLRRELTRG